MPNLRAALLCLVFVFCATVVHAQGPDRVVAKDDVTTRVVVREGATSQSADKGTLRPGESAELLGSVPNWYEVRLANGVEGFVSKRWTRVISGAAPTPPSNATAFTIDVVDVGTGLAILVRGADFTLIYDAGSNDDDARGDRNRMLAYIRAVAPGLSRIDHVILSHPHKDHVELLPDVLGAYAVANVWDSGAVNDICGYRAFVRAVRDTPALSYHVATQSGGERDIEFASKACYGAPASAETLHVWLGERIDEAPIALGQGAQMTFLHADGSQHASFNENSLVVRLDLGSTRVLLMGDSEAGGRQAPTMTPAPSSIEGALLACCRQALAADILITAHHGSRTSSRQAFLNAVMASTYVVSAGPTKYGSVILPDADIIAELTPRGQVFRTDLNDATCGQHPAKIGADADGRPGGCDNIRIIVPMSGTAQPAYWRAAD